MSYNYGKVQHHGDCNRHLCRCWCHRVTVTEYSFGGWNVEGYRHLMSPVRSDLGWVRRVDYGYPLPSQSYEAKTAGGRIIFRHSDKWACVKALLDNSKHRMPTLPPLIDSRTNAQIDAQNARLDAAADQLRQLHMRGDRIGRDFINAFDMGYHTDIGGNL